MSYVFESFEPTKSFCRDEWEMDFVKKYEKILEKLSDDFDDYDGNYILIDSGTLLMSNIDSFYLKTNPSLKDIMEIHFIYKNMVFHDDTVQKYYDDFIKSLM